MNPSFEARQLPSLKKGTRVLFANVPADGHFNPLTGIAVHLKNIGCDVRWYTASYYQDKIEKLGIPFYGLKHAMDISATNDVEQVFPERKNHKGKFAKLRFDLEHVFIRRGPEYYEDLLEIHEQFPFEVMFADITFGGIPFVKEKMNKPVFAVSVVPLPQTSKDLAPYGMGIPPQAGIIGRLKQSLLHFISNQLIFSKPTKLMTAILRSHGIETGNANIFDIHIKKSTIVLQSGTPGFEYKRSDIAPHVHFAGPLLPYQKETKVATWHHPKLKAYRKLILVTQGTVEKDTNKLLVPTLEAFKDTDNLVVVTTGGSGTKELRERYPQHNVVVEDYIPFNQIMPIADVYISNGGYGGVLMSIQNHLPMVVAGVHEGKNEINARVKYFGLGINLQTETPTSHQLKEAVEKIFRDYTYSENVSKLQKEFNRYHPNEITANLLCYVLQGRKKLIPAREEELIY